MTALARLPPGRLAKISSVYHRSVYYSAQLATPVRNSIMDEADFLAIIEALKDQFGRIGAPELGDDSFYTDREEETGRTRLQEPQGRAVAMLQAFERFLAVRDAATYHDAMGRLAQSLEGSHPDGAVVLPIDDTLDAPPIDLSEAPDFGELRDSVTQLIGQLRESGRLS